jgi:ribonuclease HIII
VVAAVWLDERGAEHLASLGVRDSKNLSDKRCQELANAIREVCRGSYKEVEILPERYNTLYGEFKRERKTLNHLLAWGHARALESLLQHRESDHAIADQFGDEGYIHSKLMERGKKLKLVQMPKAERHLAVAAASVLARDRFLFRLQEASRKLGITLPKGASPSAVEAARKLVSRDGKGSLKCFAKLHFKTTRQVLE